MKEFMERNKGFWLIFLICYFVLITLIFICKPAKEEQNKVIYEVEVDTVYVHDTIYHKATTVIINESDFNKIPLTKENFYKVCEYYEIDFPDVVYAQARLESGNFNKEISHIYRKYNNFLGLYNSKLHRYYRFDNWAQCLKGYKELLQFKYTKDVGDTNEYLNFLANLPYAEDPNYISKIKQML